MSHIHIPDGVLPLWLVALGWIVTLVFLGIISQQLTLEQIPRRLPLLGVVSALMLVSMTLEIVPIAYHINLSVVAGILLGPALGFVAAFVVDLIIAMFGHGGITVVGLNTLVIGAEIALGYHLFHLVNRFLGRRISRIGLRVGIATVLTLFLSTSLMIGVVGLANINPAWQAPLGGEVRPETISFRNPFGDGVLIFEIFPEPERPEEGASMDLLTFAELVYLLGFPGWLVEATVTGIIIAYMQRVRHDLVQVEA